MTESSLWKNIYLTITLMGVSPHQIKRNYEIDKGRAVIAIPDLEIAITTDKDKVEGFREEGWIVISLPKRDLESYSATFDELFKIFEAKRRSKTIGTTKSTSKEEQWLIDECLSLGLPIPNRNLSITNPETGKELTTPDMAWEDVKVAFFVDGLWWHQGKDDKERLEIINKEMTEDEKKRLLLKNKSSNEKDGNARSVMQIQGWITLSCTDKELHERGGVRKQAERIKLAISTRRSVQAADASNLGDLF